MLQCKKNFGQSIWTFVFSCILEWLVIFYMEIPGKYAIDYYICAGLDPAMDPYDYDKVLNTN